MGINRGTVLDLINDVHRAGGFEDYNSYSYLFNQVDTMPESKEDAEPHWIPVTERLPENGRQVLVYARSVHYALAKYDEMREAGGTYKKQWVTFDAWKPYYTIKDVIAWMPLPEPFEGVTE